MGTNGHLEWTNWCRDPNSPSHRFTHSPTRFLSFVSFVSFVFRPERESIASGTSTFQRPHSATGRTKPTSTHTSGMSTPKRIGGGRQGGGETTFFTPPSSTP